MPEDMATARQAILRAYGAELVLTPAEHGMRGAVEHAQALEQRTGAFMPRQFDNPNNPTIHEQTTAREILEASGGRVDAFVAGVGTGGTITGVARGLRAAGLSLKVVAVEPKSSAVLSGGKPGLHAIQGLGAGFVPQVLDLSQVDEVIAISDLEAERMTARLAREEGLNLGPSSGANVQASIRVASRMKAGERVVTILCDSGERYQ
jgi:cysteine synthase A